MESVTHRMSAVVLTGTDQLAFQDRPAPRALPGHSVIKVLACGLCGTDRHIVHGEYPSRPPLILGHEFAGVVHEPSPDGDIPSGTLVSIDPNISCGSCHACTHGSTAFCPRRLALGVDLDGGLAELCIVPDTQMYPVDQQVDPVRLAFAEPLACCLRGTDLAGDLAGARVAVVGGGVMGQLTAQLARLGGASAVTMVTRQAERRRLAVDLGATSACAPGEGHLGAHDVVFECAGASGTLQVSVDLARAGGTVIVLGITPQDHTHPINPYDLVAREIRIQGSFLNPRTQRRAADLVAAGLLQLDPLASRIVSLAEASESLVQAPGPSDIKVIVRPG